jgi:hypothetical protein
LLRWEVENDVKTPIFRPSAFFFLSVALLRTRKKALKAKKWTVFVVLLPTATSLLEKQAPRLKAHWLGAQQVFYFW